MALALTFAGTGAVLVAALLRDTSQELDAEACRERNFYTARDAERCVGLDAGLETRVYGLSTEPASPAGTGDDESGAEATEEPEVVLRVALTANGRRVGTAIFHTATEEFRELSGLLDYEGHLLEIDLDDLDPSGSDAQVVIRSGTCERVSPAPAERIGGWPAVYADLDGEWVVDVYRSPGDLRPIACGGHRGAGAARSDLPHPQPAASSDG